MLNRYPLWKYVLVVGVLLVSTLYALPNLYGEDPAVQVSPQRGVTVDDAVRERVLGVLGQAGLEPVDSDVDDRGLLVRWAAR